MRLKDISLMQFRNFALAQTEFDAGVNVIMGENAQGKTNLLEAVCCLSRGRSFRTRLDRELIRFGSAEAVIKGVSEARGRDFEIENRYAAGRRKRVTVNGLDPKKIDCDNILNTVCFIPEDLELIRAGEAERRRFLNNAISPLRPKYQQALAEYGRILEQKANILALKDERSDLLDTLPEFNRRLCQFGALLIRYRAAFIERLGEHASAAQRELSGGRESLELGYRTVSTVTDPHAPASEIFNELMEHIESHAAAEAATGQCLTGPHKDALEVTVNGRSVKSYGSQGQTRTAALALKLGELEITRQELNDTPVLLLDDVLSELDEARQSMVLSRISGGQVIITCCETPKNIQHCRMINIKNGEIV